MPEAVARADSADSLQTPEEKDRLVKPEDDQGDADAANNSETETAGDEDDPLTITKLFDELEGFRDAGQFRSDQEWLRSVGELKRKIGQRDEDAQVGRQLRQRLVADPGRLEALLAGGDAAPAKAAVAGPPDWNPGWLTIGQDGSLQPAFGAPKDTLERYAAYTQWASNRLHALLTDPAKFLDDVISPKLKQVEERNRVAQAEFAEQQQRALVKAACDKHRDVLYVGGDDQLGMTPLGEKIYKLVGNFARDGAAAAALIEEVAAMAPKLQVKADGKKVSSRVGRVPQAADATDRNRAETEKVLLRPGGLAQLLAESDRKQRSAAV